MSDIPRVDWFGAYDGSWSGRLCAGAFAHPAKVPFALAERIYAHMLAKGWLAPGQRVVDPFAGVACFAFHALVNGLHYEGVELEPKFQALAEENIALWNARYAGRLPRWGSARVHLGDSRRLAEILGAAHARVSSPPYADGAQHTGGLDTRMTSGQGGLIRFVDYGSTPGQLQALPAGDLDAALASPPYSESLTYQRPGAGGEGNELMRAGFSVQEIADMRRNGDPRILETRRDHGYSRDAANLGNLPAGDFDASLASPPYADQATNGARENRAANLERAGIDPEKWLGTRRCTQGRSEGYGATDGQLGTQAGDTFWAASRTILEQTYAVLRPGAVAAFVTGDYVRNKQRVPFSAQWLALCEAVGFEPLLWAVAWKSQVRGVQYDLEGNPVELRTDRVSFFRRLANAKHPESAVLNEDVLFVVRR